MTRLYCIIIIINIFAHYIYLFIVLLLLILIQCALEQYFILNMKLFVLKSLNIVQSQGYENVTWLFLSV